MPERARSTTLSRLAHGQESVSLAHVGDRRQTGLPAKEASQQPMWKVSPARTPAIGNLPEYRKTMKRSTDRPDAHDAHDAQRLAWLLRIGEVLGVRVPGEAEEARRTWCGPRRTRL
jgi:hypothetical protein